MSETLVQEVSEGSCLSADVVLAGNVILGKGARLSAPILKRLQKMGVECISVVSDEQAEDQSLSPLVVQLEQRFDRMPRNEIADQLKHVIKKHLLR